MNKNVETPHEDLKIDQDTLVKEKLRTEHDLSKHLIDTVPIGIGQVIDRKINFVNEQFAQMLDYSVQELIGKKPRFIFPCDEEFERVAQYDYEEIKRKGACNTETILRKKDGVLIEVFLSSTPTELKDLGQGLTFFALDITERKHAEEQRLDLENQLRQKHKMEAVGHMAEGIAHNFNNDLSIILGNVELSQIKLPQNSEVIPFLENAKKAIRQSRDLVLKIITYSRKGIQNKASLQLPTIVSETISSLRSTLPTTISIEQNISPACDSIVVDADASQIQEVLVNLCNNAVHAMDENGVLRISLEPVKLTQQDIPGQYEQAPGCYSQLSIQDTGSGIPTEIVDKIFDPFFSTKEEYEGAGMGLATVQGIVVQHGGLIKVSSVPGQGTVFDLYFPVINALLEVGQH